MFTKKIVLISGGTGSFGTQMLKSLINTKVKEVRIFSRDEKKQDDLRRSITDKRVNYIIGDVRDYRSTLSCTQNVDFVFQAAALKQVPTCEFFPLEGGEVLFSLFKSPRLATKSPVHFSIFKSRQVT